jgi:bifunctional UDP-N-acetylglucosamine 2-epimerase / N-acetylmannosamine kinase
MAPEDFLRMLDGAKCLVGNSSVGVRECSYLGVPAVNIGTRQAGRDRGPNVLDVGSDRDAIGAAITSHIEHGRFQSDPLYGDGHAGERMAALLAHVPLGITKRLTY